MHELPRVRAPCRDSARESRIVDPPDRLVVRHDRLGKPGAPLVVPLPPGARVLFCVQRPTRRKQRNQGILHVEVDGRLIRLADTAAHDTFTAIAATLNAASTRAAHP